MVIEARSQSSRLWQSAGYLLAASSHSERGKGALWGPFYKGTIPITRLHPHNLIAFQRPHHIGIWVSISEILVDTNIPAIAMPAFYFWGARIEAQYPGPEWGPLSLLIRLSLTVALADCRGPWADSAPGLWGCGKRNPQLPAHWIWNVGKAKCVDPVFITYCIPGMGEGPQQNFLDNRNIISRWIFPELDALVQTHPAVLYCMWQTSPQKEF